VALSGYKIHQVSFEWKDDLTTNKQWVHTYVQAQTYSNLNKNFDYKGLEYLALQSNQIKKDYLAYHAQGIHLEKLV